MLDDIKKDQQEKPKIYYGKSKYSDYYCLDKAKYSSKLKRAPKSHNEKFIESDEKNINTIKDDEKLNLIVEMNEEKKRMESNNRAMKRMKRS